MSDFEFDPEDVDFDDHMNGDIGEIGGGIEAPEGMPDPIEGSDAPEPHFSGTVSFPDGSTIEDPYQDHLGNVYKSHDEWMDGINKHVVDESGSATPAS